jgi:hypothetical protein
VHSGDNPIHDSLATSSEITETNSRFLAHAVSDECYCITAAALKAQLLDAVPDTFINTLRLPGLGYACVTALNILEHLDNEYGKLSTKDLNYNILL